MDNTLEASNGWTLIQMIQINYIHTFMQSDARGRSSRLTVNDMMCQIDNRFNILMEDS